MLRRSWMSRILSVFAGIFLLQACSLLPTEEKVLQPPLVPPVKDRSETSPVERGTIVREVKGIGTFETVRNVPHRFTGSGGILKEIFVKPGDIVSKGDLLAQLDIEDLDIALLELELMLERAKTNYLNNREDRASELELQLAMLRYEKAKQKLDSRYLYAEMDGTVVFVSNHKPLSWVDEGTVMLQIGDTSEIHFFYEALESKDISSVQVGMAAEVTVRGTTYVGRVMQTPYSSPFTEDMQLMQRYAKTLYIDFDDLPADVKIGDRGEMVITTERRDDTLIIPKRGLRSYLGRNYVYVMDGESRREIDVEVGIVGTTHVEIVNGLSEGQLVVLQ